MNETCNPGPGDQSTGWRGRYTGGSIPPLIADICLPRPAVEPPGTIDCHTVMFSGSHSLWNYLERIGFTVRRWHARPQWAAYIESGNLIATSYRDPYETAASWLNRDKPLKYLYPQWHWWVSRIVPRASFCIAAVDRHHAELPNYTPDKRGYHNRLAEGDLSWVPDDVHEFAAMLGVRRWKK